jgi:VWFA-related protein
MARDRRRGSGTRECGGNRCFRGLRSSAALQSAREVVMSRQSLAWIASMACVILVCGALARVRAQQPTDSTPTFRAGVEAVAFEVFVTDSAGKPVTDLTVDDFELLEEGQPQPITTFASTVIPIEPALGKAETWSVPPDVVTNATPPGRTYIFALDELVIPPAEAQDALRVRLFLRRFLEKYFGPNDVGAVIEVGRGLATDGQTFTSNPQLLLKAIDKFGPGYHRTADPRFSRDAAPARSETTDPDTRRRLSALKDMTESLAAIPGRKTVLYITEEIGFDMFTAVDYHGGVMMLAAEDAHAIVSAATRANVIFYPINPIGLVPDRHLDLEDRMDLTSLATVSGGFALQDSNSFMQTFERIQRESSSYYTLGFNSAHEKRDGRMVRVDVKVKRPGLRVKSREGYLAPLGERRSTDKEGDKSPALDAMASPVLTRGVSMQVFAAPYRSPTRDNAVALVVEIDPETLGLADQNGVRTGSVEVTYSATDTRKRAYLGGRHTFPLSLTPAAYDQARTQGLRVVSTLSLPKGTFELRVGAASGSRTGSVVHHFEVPDSTDGRLTMSGVALSTGSATAETVLRPPRGTRAASPAVKCSPPSCIVPLTRETPSSEEPLVSLPGGATARRVFDRSEELVMFAEVYENGRQPSHQITFVTTLEGEDHAVRPLTSETRAVAANGQTVTTGFLARTALRDVAPGRYLLRLQARSDAARNLTTERAIPIAVR